MQERNWYPISDILIIGKHINELLEDSKAQYEELLPIKNYPSSLDDETVDRIKKLFTDRIEIIAMYEEQVDKWKLENTERELLDILELNIKQLKVINAKILDLADDLSKYTIEEIMSMEEGELGLKVLLGEIPLPKSLIGFK